MELPEILKFRQFDFYDTDPYIEMCYNLAHESLEKMYPQYLLFASDNFGISVIDNNNDECVEVTSFSTGRLGKIGGMLDNWKWTGLQAFAKWRYSCLWYWGYNDIR